ncbi:MAG: hypothetical protein JXA64_01540 [Candidatus Fermentibacteraceae bacterium]|nr:hypothetical protein [Candidatus Fermentibacteraceae bacterium]MBN2607770.1 hypothetical protein [Candidatus Fermentibacteraceae bacterium]
MKVIPVLLTLTAAAFAWTCPACGNEGGGEFCRECGLPQPPPGMEFVPACSVSVEGQMLHVPAFFIDTEPVKCRNVLSWLTDEISYIEQVPVYLTGQESLLMPGESISEDFRDVVFVRYTPWVIYRDVQGVIEGFTVQTGCFDCPAVALTFDAARLYLNDMGKRLPTETEMAAAASAGVIGYKDTWEVMNSYSDFMSMTVSGIIGVSPAGMAMFSENETPEERIMWEWTGNSWAQPPDSIPDFESPYALIVKPLAPLVRGAALRDSGYFNVIFRGVVSLPWYEQS